MSSGIEVIDVNGRVEQLFHSVEARLVISSSVSHNKISFFCVPAHFKNISFPYKRALSS